MVVSTLRVVAEVEAAEGPCLFVLDAVVVDFTSGRDGSDGRGAGGRVLFTCCFPDFLLLMPRITFEGSSSLSLLSDSSIHTDTNIAPESRICTFGIGLLDYSQLNIESFLPASYKCRFT